MAKDPNEYPLFGYRVLPKIKETVAKELEDVLKLKNKKSLKPFKKNEIFIDALRVGLKQMKEEVTK